MNSGLFGRWLRRCLPLACAGWLSYPGAMAGAERVYDAADLVRVARMLAGEIPPDPDDADMDGDGEVTKADLDLMLRRVHGRELPERLDQKTIGSAGGDLGNADTIRLIVPSGAFDTDFQLTLERVPNAERPSIDGDRGPLYQISGIPDEVPVALTIRIPAPDGVDPADMALEIGEYTHGSMSGLGWFYRYVEAAVDGQDLVWHAPPIPPYSGDRATGTDGGESGAATRATAGAIASSSRASYRWRFQPTGSGRLPQTVPTLVGDRFRLIWPASTHGPPQAARTNAWALIDGLETAYTKLSADYDFSPRTSWPVDVYIKRLSDEEPGGEMVSSFWGVNYHWIEMDDRYLFRSRQDRLPIARITAAHEFFHIVQSFYHARKDPLWLDEATATWFEKHIAEGDPADYLPEHFPMMPRTALRGMHIEPGWFAYSMKDVQARGYTLASFVEYADRRHNFGLAGIAQLYARLRAGDHPVLALMTAIPGDAADFKNLWRDYTRDFFNSPVWPAGNTSTLLADPPPGALSAVFISELNQDNTDYAFGRRAEGPFGRILSVDTQDDFATLREYRMRVQQLGARSIAVSMMDRDFTDQLPDTVRMIGEVQWENEDDMSNLRLVPVFDGGPGPGSSPPVVLPMDLQTWIMHRSTHRIEVSFPRPPGRFTYMLGVFNDDVQAPYNRTPNVTLRHYIGSYRVPPSKSVLRMLSPVEPIAVGELRDALLHGDLGTVRTFKMMPGLGLGVRDTLGILVLLPHDDRTPVRVRMDGGLKHPLTRIVEFNQQRWTVTATEDIGWRLGSSGSGIENENALSEVIPAAEAWTTGIDLSAPEAGGRTFHPLYYYFSSSVYVEDLNEYGATAPYTWTTDSFYVMPLLVVLQSPQAP